MSSMWKRSLALVCASQFLSIAAFAFGLPFAPFFMQEELGITDPVRLKFWITLFAGATPLMFAVSAPFWGRVADRHGRRLMLIRANLCGAVVLSLMGFVVNAPQLILLRLLQGALTGTATAAQAMIAGVSPEEHHGRAQGWLNSAVYMGSMAGAAAGGWFAHGLGYRPAFWVSGLLLAISAALVWRGVPEHRGASDDDFIAEPPPAPRWIAWRHSSPWLVGMTAVAFTRQLDMPFLPLIVQEIHGGVAGAAAWTGALNACGGLAGLLAGVWMGPVADRVRPERMMGAAALCAGAAALGQASARGFAILLISRFVLVFCAAALEPALQAWLARATPPARRGAAFGIASGARAVGWFSSAPVAGVLAGVGGVRGLLCAVAGCYGLLAWALPRAIRMRRTDGGRTG